MRFLLILLSAIIFTAYGCTAVKTGDPGAKTLATGAAGGDTATDANPELVHCDQPLGTIAVVEDTYANWHTILRSRYNLPSTEPVLRLLIQQSNCFIVVDRGRAMGATVMRERLLQGTGELRQGSDFGKGQMVSADYALTPEVIFSEKGTRGMGGALGVFGLPGLAVGALAGGLKQNEASTLLTLVDNRSSVQVAVAEGSAKNVDFALGGFGAGGSVGGGLGGYTNTPQGKVIVGAFLDSYNQLVTATRNYSAQSMGDRGLGTGGRLEVDGAEQAREAGQNSKKLKKSSASMSTQEAQERLLYHGYHEVGIADGIMGNKTTEALRQFQADHGLPVSGRLGPATREELRKD